jgi:putative heme iron utilization protein
VDTTSAAASAVDPVALLRSLLAETRVAALATLHRGDPAVSMVPFALDRSAGALLLHVSALATHTRDMSEHAAVSLLVTAAETTEVPPQARARASLTGTAEFIARDGAGHGAARAIYLARFPQSGPIFDLADFSLVRVTPHSARVIGGFAQAASLVGERLQQAMR